MRRIPPLRRLKGVAYCAWYGLLPWWAYECVKHHRGSYLDHLAANARHAWTLLTEPDDESSLQYEAVVNGPWDAASAAPPDDCIAA